MFDEKKIQLTGVIISNDNPCKADTETIKFARYGGKSVSIHVRDLEISLSGDDVKNALRFLGDNNGLRPCKWELSLGKAVVKSKESEGYFHKLARVGSEECAIVETLAGTIVALELKNYTLKFTDI
jgi:hypothetical protein